MSEVFFGSGESAAYKGIPGMILQSSDEIDPEPKMDVLSCVIICGGTCQYKMLVERLEQELIPEMFYNYKVKQFVGARGDCRIFSWLGASIIGALNIFDTLLVSKNDYEEHGYSLIERRFN